MVGVLEKNKTMKVYEFVRANGYGVYPFELIGLKDGFLAFYHNQERDEIIKANSGAIAYHRKSFLELEIKDLRFEDIPNIGVLINDLMIPFYNLQDGWRDNGINCVVIDKEAEVIGVKQKISSKWLGKDYRKPQSTFQFRPSKGYGNGNDICF